MSLNREILEMIKSVKSLIELETESGIREYLKDPKDKEAITRGKERSEESALEEVELGVMSCRLCGLSKGRNNVVFGAGNPNAKLMYVGEGPGYEEDMQGLPFVGRAGRLLTKIIEAMGLKRRDVYIANIVKCRPPQNRNPLPTEILSCEEYLEKQIKLINPKVICVLGRIAAQALLKTQEPISKLRGRFFSYKGIKVMPTFHPAYLLRNPQDKRLVWQDMKKIMSELG
ncbi:MAG: uracil-DNA glycosylase [Candidatus Omnitrophica bacterium]|nr:uracil-DNA glycosylase [Candidatus Omnitrophota bacterium]